MDISTSADSGEKECDLWVRDEEHVGRAKEELDAFRAAPESPKYRVSDDANRIRKQQEAEEKRRRSHLQKPRHQTATGGAMMGVPIQQQSIPVVITILVLSVVIGFATGMGNPAPSRVPGEPTSEQRVFNSLLLVTGEAYWETKDPYALVKQGQFWRLFSHMFLHGNTIHLAFNMLGLFFIGSILERLHGSFFIAFLILSSVLIGTLVQIHLPSPDRLPEILHGLAGTAFPIGVSGGVYGLFGYIWVRPALTPGYPVRLPQSSVLMILGWIPFCIFFVPGIANGAHIGGLIAGMLVAAGHARLSGGSTT